MSSTMPHVPTPTAGGIISNVGLAATRVPRSSAQHPERSPEVQLQKAEQEAQTVPKKVVASLVLLLVHSSLGLYSVLVQLFGKGSDAASSAANPFVFSALRDLIGCPVIFAAGAAVELPGRRLLPRLPFRSELTAFVTLGFLLFGNNENNVIGTYLTDAPTASFAQQIIPVLGAFFSAFAGLETFPTVASMQGAFKLLGLALSTTGAALLVIQGHSAEQTATQQTSRSVGEFCLLLNAVSTAAYFTLQHKLTFANPMRNRSAGFLRGLERGVLRRWGRAPLLTASYTYAFSCAFSTLSMLIRFGVSGFKMKLFYVSRTAWISILFAALIASTICYAVLTWVNKLLRPGVTTGTIPIQALSSTVLSSFLLGIPITMGKALAGAVVISGVLCLLIGRSYEEDETPEESDGPGSPSVSTRSSLDSTRLSLDRTRSADQRALLESIPDTAKEVDA